MSIRLSTFLQSRVNVFIYQKLSWKVCLYYLMLLGRIYFLINSKEKKEIESSVAHVFGQRKKNGQITSIKRKVFQGVLHHYYEKIYNAYESIERLKGFFQECIVANDLNILDRALSKGKGVLFVTGHYGAVEYIPIFLALNGYPVSVIAKFATQQLEHSLCLKTRGIGLKLVNAEKERNLLKIIIEELKKNRIVFYECDEIEEWRPSSKKSMWFLRKMIGVDRSIDVIHKRTGAEIIFGLMHRFNLNRYRLILEDFQDMSFDVSKMHNKVGETVLRCMEKYIYSYPEEWYQWKNYPVIQALNVADVKIEKPVPVMLFKPAFNKV
ncbi:MAG: lysophospholipid acyltransferase family protein [Deltaproteobacteria bacterium]|nr:lysophospholipid acyltransferase family protein [Deltaproteobacteria bacterium]